VSFISTTGYGGGILAMASKLKEHEKVSETESESDSSTPIETSPKLTGFMKVMNNANKISEKG
jgi:hypothetical protein